MCKKPGLALGSISGFLAVEMGLAAIRVHFAFPARTVPNV